MRVSTKPVDFGHGIRMVYLPVNQAWVVLWKDQIVRGPIPRHEAMAEAAQITGASPSEASPPRRIGRLANRAGTRKRLGEAAKFFAKNAGFSYGPGESKAAARKRNGRALAEAEAQGEARGWSVIWEEDPEGWDSIGDVPPETIDEVLWARLVDAEGETLGSLGSIIFGKSESHEARKRYGRVVEAELMQEALAESR